MPAPIAKGIILLSSVLIAAGVAAYENPEVRAWFEERRRKIALTLNEIADEIADEFNPHRAARRRRTASDDASRNEDNSAEAAERRKKARQEIMERGILLDQKRRQAKRTDTSSSFDKMVDSDGKLREKDSAITTSAQEPASERLRNRMHNSNAMAMGSAVANPFDDEMGGIIDEKTAMEQESHRERSTTLVASPNLQIDTGINPATTEAERANLTPTTSVAASTLISDGMFTPTSTTHPESDLHELPSRPQQAPLQSYQSIQEWASATSSGPASFYSPPESERQYQNLEPNTINTPSRASSMTASVIGTNDVRSENGDFGVETLSDVGNDTTSSWSEVGSQISED